MATVKLAITSDLHLPITKAEAITALGRQIKAFGPQPLIVAGDVGESLADVQRGLHLLREQVHCPIWVLAGNHDLWARPPYDSRQLWLEQIPAAVRAAGCQWLEGVSFVLDGVAVTGTIRIDSPFLLPSACRCLNGMLPTSPGRHIVASRECYQPCGGTRCTPRSVSRTKSNSCKPCASATCGLPSKRRPRSSMSSLPWPAATVSTPFACSQQAIPPLPVSLP
jgi:hypothetical protein